MFEASAMVSPEEKARPSRQGFRYSKRSIIVNKKKQLVVSRKIGEDKFYAQFFDSNGRIISNETDEFYNQQQFGSKPVDDEGNLLLDMWGESSIFGDLSYGQKQYDDMVADLQQAKEDEDKINELRQSARNEFESWKNDLNARPGVYSYLRDMKITEMIFGVRKEKAQRNIHDAFLASLDDAYNHQSNELKIALKNTEKALNNTKESLKKSKKQLKKNPNNKNFINKTIQQLIDKQNLINQEKLVKSEIKSFQNLNNRDSFYRSSMSGKNFELFQQCRASQPQNGTRE